MAGINVKQQVIQEFSDSYGNEIHEGDLLLLCIKKAEKTENVLCVFKGTKGQYGNTFIQTYFDKVDDPMNTKLIENVVDSENIRTGAYAPEYWAGASMEYRKDDNPTTDILAGKMTFRQHIAPYTPAQEINNVLSYDTDMLAAALGGE